MCGIAGTFCPAGTTPDLVERTSAMIRTLGHRGPDGFSVMALRGAVLAHARLAIIDLVTGTQPIGNEDGTVQVVLNGEIYNYRELRAELEQRGAPLPHAVGHRGRSPTSTKTRASSSCRGCVACSRSRCTTRSPGSSCSRATGSARSRSTGPGRPPASSSRASLGPCSRCEGVDRRTDPEAVAHYLTWQYVPAPWSIYRGIRKLPAATLLVADARGERFDALLGRRALPAAAAGRRRGALEARGDPVRGMPHPPEERRAGRRVPLRRHRLRDRRRVVAARARPAAARRDGRFRDGGRRDRARATDRGEGRARPDGAHARDRRAPGSRRRCFRSRTSRTATRPAFRPGSSAARRGSP